MDIKLIACDLDGTLLADDLTVSKRTRAAVRKVREGGIKFCLATGRMFCSAARFAGLLELDTPLIAYNGALIKDVPTGKVYLSKPLERAAAGEVLVFGRENGFYAQKYVHDRLYVERLTERTERYSRRIGVRAEEEGEEFYRLSSSPDKILFVVDPARQAFLLDELQRRFAGRIFVTSSSDHFVEVISPGVNKGDALAWLAGLWRIERTAVMAVGDSFNDLEMIRWAGTGVAMGGAPPQIRAAADFVTAGNNENGVAAALEKYVLK